MAKLLLVTVLLASIAISIGQIVDVCTNPGIAKPYGTEWCQSLSPTERCRLGTLNLLYAAGNGDINSLRRFKEDGLDLSLTDYDRRAALHLAAAEGNLEAVQFLLTEAKVPSKPTDRWGSNPLDESIRFNRTEVSYYLNKYYKSEPSQYSVGRILEAVDVCANPATSKPFGSDWCQKVTRTEGCRLGIMNLLFAAANGDVGSLRKYNEAGLDMTLADYDNRSALHLAAAEGRLESVQYLLNEAKVPSKPVDRWGSLPLDDAIRFNQTDVTYYLNKFYASESPSSPTLHHVYLVPVYYNHYLH